MARIADVHNERDNARERAEWDRTAWLAAQIINISGRSVKRNVKAKDLISFPDEPRAEVTPMDIEGLKRQALEIAKFHKSKFWTLIKDRSIEKLEQDVKAGK